MGNKKTYKPQGNIYDRIFRENAEDLFMPFIEKFLNIEIVSYKILPVKFPKTSENEVDFLYEIEQANKTKQILHVEFQSTDDPKMLERMQEYHSKIFKKYKLPIKPLVINLSKQAFTGRTKLMPEEIFTGYEVINLFQLSTKDLLSDQVPEVVLLALLSNYKAHQFEAVLRLIVKKLKQLVHNEKDLRRYINQLLLLSRLRNFEIETENILDNMPVTYDIETDGLYLKGVEKGLIKTILFCDKIGMQAQEIADEFNFSLTKVLEIIKLHKK